MTAHATQADVELSDYMGVVRRHWRLVALCVTLGVCLAAIAIVVIPKTFTSTVSVMVRPIGEDGAVQGGRTSSALNMDTEAQVVKSTSVAQRADEGIGGSTGLTAQDLTKHVMVSVPPNTSVLNIAFSAESATAAQKGADAFAEAYLENRKAVADQAINSETGAFSDQLEEVEKELSIQSARLAKLPSDSPQRVYESAQRDLLIQQIATLNSELLKVKSVPVMAGSILTEAQRPRAPSSPNVLLIGMSGLFMGLLIGLMLAFGKKWADKSIRDRRDLERLGLEILVADVIKIQGGSDILRDVGVRGEESMRQLRNVLLARLPDERGVVLVTSVSDDVTGSAVAANLAKALARSGVDVLFVGANEKGAGVTEGLIPEGHPGLAQVLREEATVADAVWDVPSEENLRVVAVGSSGRLAGDLLRNKRDRLVFGALADESQVMIVDVSSTSINADAQSLATLGYGVLLVATATRSERDDAAGAMEQLHHVSASIFGGVVAVANSDSTQSRSHSRRSGNGRRGLRKGGSETRRAVNHS